MFLCVFRGEYEVATKYDAYRVLSGDMRIVQSDSGYVISPAGVGEAVCFILKRAYLIGAIYGIYGHDSTQRISIDEKVCRFSEATGVLLRSFVEDFSLIDGALKKYYGSVLIHRILTDIARRPRQSTCIGREALLERITDFIIESQDRNISMGYLSSRMGISRRALFLIFKKEFNLTPSQVINNIKIDLAYNEIMGNKDISITDVALEFGFSNPGRFSGMYMDRIGELPSQTKRNVKLTFLN